MSQERLDDCLHLPSLSIKGFRGIKELSIERLGRVTLLAGKNGVGKTTILDAVQVYAARGRPSVLSELLESREEISAATDENDESIEAPDFAALFYGRNASGACISIGPKSDSDQLRIEWTALSDEQVSRLEEFLHGFITNGHTQALKIVFQDAEQVLPLFLTPKLATDKIGYQYVRRLLKEAESPSPIEYHSLDPGLLSNNEIARFWDAIALTDDEDRAVQALKLILGNEVDRVAVIGDDDPRSLYRGYGRRVVVKLQGQARPVPLKSLGDGALRLFSVALAQTNSRGGFLLIDEAENGIHHSMQPDFWRMVFKTAYANNVQVIATTHSFDCVRGFAQAAVECEEVEGALVRIERKDEEMWGVEYSESDLRIAAEQRIEVR
ncbi:MAG: AAA family ATPase [Gemmatimonadetes bacterium]|nr:AAA family ATPase [Gemmatimonadota bacterium]MDE2736768.1 AAA family ATPase [Gemmatimonadota bacterium]